MYNEIDLDAIDTTQEPPTEEPARQYYFMAKCREWVREFERKNGRRPCFFTQTFGCPILPKGKNNLRRVHHVQSIRINHRPAPIKQEIKCIRKNLCISHVILCHSISGCQYPSPSLSSILSWPMW